LKLKGTGHEQVVVKVNAQVDKGIAPLVEALNGFDGVITLDSCERGVTGASYVFFLYGSGWRELGRFPDWLSVRLRALDLCCGYSLRLEWFGSNEQPRAQLVLQPEYIDALAAAIRGAIYPP